LLTKKKHDLRKEVVVIKTIFSLAICDDEAHQRLYLTSLVTEWAGKRGYIACIDEYESAEQFVMGRTADYDILLLDIQMGKQSGVELAKDIRKVDERTVIIFITGVPDFIQEGYDVSALHYLMKPVDEAKLAAVLDKAAIKVMKSAEEESFVLLPVDGEPTRFAAKDILYIESFAHDSELVTTNGNVPMKVAISKLEAQLAAQGIFCRCHRSYLVNLQRVAKITKTDVVLDNGNTVPLSRRMYGDVNRAFMALFKGRL